MLHIQVLELGEWVDMSSNGDHHHHHRLVEEDMEQAVLDHIAVVAEVDMGLRLGSSKKVEVLDSLVRGLLEFAGCQLVFHHVRYIAFSLPERPEGLRCLIGSSLGRERKRVVVSG